MTMTTNFLGIPVDGDITRGEKRAAQRPLSELEPLIRAVLDDPTMHSFGWTQYTPYFNDGEPCVFGVNEPWFRTVDDAVDEAAERERKREGLAGLRAAVDAGTVHPDVLARAEAEIEDPEDDYNYVLSSYGDGHPSLGKRGSRYDQRTREYVDEPYVGPDEARYDRVAALSKAIQSGAFDDVLLEAFGDHAAVTVKADGITVESYDHD